MKGFLKKIVLFITASALVTSVWSYDTFAKARLTYTVRFIYGDKVNEQTVKQGQNAVIPTDTEITGFTFLGWIGNANNIQEDTTISGLYINNTPYATATNALSVAKRINDKTTAPFLPWWPDERGVPGKTCVVRWYNGWNNELFKTEVVPYGTTLPDPPDPCIEDLSFVGWEGSWINITEDRAIKAWYAKKE